MELIIIEINWFADWSQIVNLYHIQSLKIVRFTKPSTKRNNCNQHSMYKCFRISKDEACGKSKELKQVNGRFLKRTRKLEDKNANWTDIHELRLVLSVICKSVHIIYCLRECYVS